MRDGFWIASLFCPDCVVHTLDSDFDLWIGCNLFTGDTDALCSMRTCPTVGGWTFGY